MILMSELIRVDETLSVKLHLIQVLAFIEPGAWSMPGLKTNFASLNFSRSFVTLPARPSSVHGSLYCIRKVPLRTETPWTTCCGVFRATKWAFLINQMEVS